MFSVETKGADKIEIDLREYPNRVNRAIVRALNRGINSGRTAMVREIAADTGMKQKDIRDALRLRQATLAEPRVVLAATLKRIPLIAFNARQTSAGVSYRLRNGRGKLEGAFIATTRVQGNGTGGTHRGVFKRVLPSVRKSVTGWSKNLPIKERYGPSLGHVFAKFRAIGQARAWEMFEKNLDHELGFAKGLFNAGAD
jgi:hypothetical protein